MVNNRNSLLALLAIATPALLRAQNPTGCLDEVNEGTDYFPDKVEALSSEFWDINYFNTYKILKNEIEDESYLLYQCGSEPPTSELDGRHKAVISVPISNGAAVSQTTHIPHLETLGMRTQIQGYLGDPQYISSPCVNQMIDDGDIIVVENISDSTALQGLLASSGEDLVSFVGSFNPVPLNNSVIVSAFNEKTNAGVYEWNKYFSAFFNLEALANELYEEINNNYLCTAENAGRAATDAATIPTVLWAYFSSTYNGWDVAKCPNYYCEYAEICSVDLLNSFEGSIQGFGGSKLMTTEEFLAFGKEAEHWIFPSGDWVNVYSDQADTLNQFQSVQNKQVFDYQGSGSNAWFENRLVEFGEWPLIYWVGSARVILDTMLIFFATILMFINRCCRARLLRGCWHPKPLPLSRMVSQRIFRAGTSGKHKRAIPIFLHANILIFLTL